MGPTNAFSTALHSEPTQCCGEGFGVVPLATELAGIRRRDGRPNDPILEFEDRSLSQQRRYQVAGLRLTVVQAYQGTSVLPWVLTEPTHCVELPNGSNNSSFFNKCLSYFYIR